MTRWQPHDWPVGAGWEPVVADFLSQQAGRQLGQFMEARLAQGAVIYPPEPFRALQITPLADVRVLILGQDPYHGPGQAEGLAFSVSPGVRPPPSLRNIFKELARDPRLASPVADSSADRPRAQPSSGSLVSWARQGVLLLNTCLTVEQGQPASHAKRGWEVLTYNLIKTIIQQKSPTVFMLWGAHAQQFGKLAGELGKVGSTLGMEGRHLVLMSNHPSPLSALRPPVPFIGCGHFSLANEFLVRHGCAPVHWQAA